MKMVFPVLMLLLSLNAYCQHVPDANDSLISLRLLPGNVLELSIYAPRASSVSLSGSCP
jgi:hypothetical protein